MSFFQSRYSSALSTQSQPEKGDLKSGCKRDVAVRDRDRDLPKFSRDRGETETFDFGSEAETETFRTEIETFFETFIHTRDVGLYVFFKVTTTMTSSTY